MSCQLMPSLSRIFLPLLIPMILVPSVSQEGCTRRKHRWPAMSRGYDDYAPPQDSNDSLPNPPPTEVLPVEADDTSIGSTKSRYASDSPLWRLMDTTIPRVEDLDVVAQGFRFTRENPDRHAEGAFGMAASIGVQDIVTGEEIHQCFCPDSFGPCPTAHFASPRSSECAFSISTEKFNGPFARREDALEECRRQQDGLIDWVRRELRLQKGVVLNVYAHQAFPDLPDNPSRLANVHAFAVYGIDKQGALLLRDAADRVPVTYRLRHDRTCEALAAPAYFVWGQEQGDYEAWGLYTWTISVSEERRQAVTQYESNSEGVVWAGENGLPSVRIPGKFGDDPFDMGIWSIPEGRANATNQIFQSGDSSPSQFQLGVGVDYSENRRSSQWLERLVNDRKSAGSDREGRTSDGRRTFPTLEAAYSLALKNEEGALRTLAAHFAGTSHYLRKDQDGLALQVIRFVQSIPYEPIPNPDDVNEGLRPPVSVLHSYAGDCDSKSLLAAVVLALLGRESAVVYSIPEEHAVLGLVADDWGGVVIHENGKRYVMVEMTARRLPGDMSDSNLSVGDDPKSRGWISVPVEMR